MHRAAKLNTFFAFFFIAHRRQVRAIPNYLDSYITRFQIFKITLDIEQAEDIGDSLFRFRLAGRLFCGIRRL